MAVGSPIHFRESVPLNSLFQQFKVLVQKANRCILVFTFPDILAYYALKRSSTTFSIKFYY